MDEIQLLRRQMSGERERLAAVAAVLAELLDGGTGAAPGTQEALLAYLRQSLQSFAAREQRLESLLVQQAAAAPASRTLRNLLEREPRAAQLLAQLQLGQPAWRGALTAAAGDWPARAAQLEAEFASFGRPPDWRAVSGIDADSILAERRQFAALRELLPGLARAAGR